MSRPAGLIDPAVLYAAAWRDTDADAIVVGLVSTRHYARALQEVSEAYADRGSFGKAEMQIQLIPHCAQDEIEAAWKHLKPPR